MKYIVCHGLGETKAQWEAVTVHIPFQTECPDLFDMVRKETKYLN